jgi:hypothetical protein
MRTELTRLEAMVRKEEVFMEGQHEEVRKTNWDYGMCGRSAVGWRLRL